MAEPEIRSARNGRADELLELLHALRKDLERKGERTAPSWTEEAVADLRAGNLTGWYRPPGEGTGEVGFYSLRAGRAFGHLHVMAGPNAVVRGLAIAGRLAADPGIGGRPLTLGVSGLSEPEEIELARDWAAVSGRFVTVREGLEHPLHADELREAFPIPPGIALRPVEEITEEAIADLDWRGFQGSEDARLFADNREENARLVSGILEGRLGRFLGEASTAMLDEEGRLAGVVLTVEVSPQVGLFADLVVDPALRGRGLGRFLVRWGFRALLSLGYERARLWVTEGNLPARRLYDRMGFAPYARSRIFRQEVGRTSPHPQADR